MFNKCISGSVETTRIWVDNLLNTQSCIQGLLVVRDFCLRVVRVAGRVRKEKFEADYEQLLMAVFSCFQGSNFFKSFF